LLGPVLGGWLVYAAGFPGTFMTAGVFGCVGVMLFALLHLNPPPPRVKEKGLKPVLDDMWQGFRIVAHNTRVLITSATDGAKMIANGALMAFLPIYALSIGLNPGEAGLLFGVQGVISFLSKPVMGRVSDQVGRKPLIMVGLLICATTFVLIPHVSSFLLLLFLAAGFGFGEAVITSSISAFVADVSELKTLGAAMGMQGTISDIGHASGPLLAGLLIAHLGYQSAFAIIAAIQLFAAALFWTLVKK
jgi:MFS transporter, DHA1 family, multidrug resistance protein